MAGDLPSDLVNSGRVPFIDVRREREFIAPELVEEIVLSKDAPFAGCCVFELPSTVTEPLQD